ncbi:MAG: metallothionein [Pseudanabaenaceae cyanobacterium bins.68]|nr:metallothionein [Pseudanabaenaceae cyanobacterium bins.68]
MSTLELVKCACGKNCSCEVAIDLAVIVNGLYYCSQACADGHAGNSVNCGCGNASCGCGAA